MSARLGLKDNGMMVQIPVRVYRGRLGYGGYLGIHACMTQGSKHRSRSLDQGCDALNMWSRMAVDGGGK